MNEDITARAQRLVANARTDTVTESLLAGGDEYTGEFFLHGDPPITHLKPNEQPHAALFNDLKGVGVGSKRNTVTPDGSASSVFLITDERILLLVGHRDGDWARTVPLEDVTGGEYHTGLMKHRVVVFTTETPYHLWTDASYQERDLEAIVELLESAAEDASETETAGVATDGATDERRQQTTPTDTGSGTRGSTSSDSPGRRSETTADEDTTESDAGDDAATDEHESTDSTESDEDGDRESTDSDPLEMLERLKELNDNGVITDEEFQEKKSDLLDQI